ncbi:MAG: hypothetical protein NZM02_00475, partial [Patescibacteria group bacterium]|nr:hypothetical protein [Patescibacteria group bacterium]
MIDIRNEVNKDDYRFYNKIFKEKSDEFNLICAAMDIIEDSLEALKEFAEKGLGSRIGEKYLRLYGIFQAVFIQQDSLFFLYKIIKKILDKSNILKDFSIYSLKKWKELRNYRNLIVGHPIE